MEIFWTPYLLYKNFELKNMYFLYEDVVIAGQRVFLSV